MSERSELIPCIKYYYIDFKTSRRQLSLEDVQQFLESRGYNIEEALDVGSTIDKMTVLKLKSSKQTTLLK